MGPYARTFKSPLFSRLFATKASWPVASMAIFGARAMGSTQVICLGRAETGDRFMTTPSTLLLRWTTSSNFVRFSILAPASHVAEMSFEQAAGQSATKRPTSISLCGIFNSSMIVSAGALNVRVFIKYPPIRKPPPITITSDTMYSSNYLLNSPTIEIGRAHV